MYSVTIKHSVTARHYLTGGDFGDANEPHPHEYEIELRLEGDKLDEFGFLVNIVDVKQALEREINRFQGKLLNDFEEFAGKNPTLEQFARVLGFALVDDLVSWRLSAMEVTLWEDPYGAASWRREF